MIAVFTISCGDKFDPIQIPDDVLPPGEISNLTVKPGDQQVELKWIAPIDFDLAGYQLTFSPGGTDPISLDKVGEYTVDGLQNDIEYTFTISTVDILGNTSNGTNILATPSFSIGSEIFPFTEDFNSSCASGGLPSDWIIFSQASDIDWTCTERETNNFAAQGNGFGGSEAAADWLIMPKLLLEEGNTAILSFEYSTEFSDSEGFGLDLRISTDYSGEGDPANATWTSLAAGIDNSRGSSEYISSTPVSLSEFTGFVHIAFFYNSSGTGGGQTLRARIDNVTIEEAPLNENFNEACPDGVPTGWTSFSVGSEINWTCTERDATTGDYAYQGNGFGGSEAAEDWLITPALDLVSGNALTLTFEYSTEFSDIEGFGLDVRISTDYTGVGDPTLANWESLPANIDNTRGSNEYTNASPISLSAYTRTAYIAFFYNSSGTGGGETLRARVDNITVK